MQVFCCAWVFRTQLLWKLRQTCRWPWIPEPSLRDLPPSWVAWRPRGSPDTSRALWAAGGAAGAKAPLGKGPQLGLPSKGQWPSEPWEYKQIPSNQGRSAGLREGGKRPTGSRKQFSLTLPWNRQWSPVYRHWGWSQSGVQSVHIYAFASPWSVPSRLTPCTSVVHLLQLMNQDCYVSTNWSP